MKWHRVYGIMLRHYYNHLRSLDRLSDMFYWPTIDLLLWGITSTYFASVAENTNFIVIQVLAGLALWMIIYMSTNSFATGILQELWDRNLMNVLVSPLTYFEWLFATGLFAVVKSLVSYLMTIALSLMLYKTNLFSFTLTIAPHILLLIMTSWWVSFLITASILRYGTRIQTLAWTLVYVLSPFSGVFYPISTLPPLVQKISHLIPTSYVFESMREALKNPEHFSYTPLWIAFGLNLVYLVISVIYLISGIESVRTKGLDKIY